MRDTESGFECERKERWRVGFGGGVTFSAEAASGWGPLLSFLPLIPE